MTSYEKPKSTSGGRFYGFHHVEFYVANAKQVADWNCVKFGFKRFAYKGLETGSREICSHAIRQNNIIFVFTTQLTPIKTQLTDFVEIHGDAVRDVAFNVDNCSLIYEKAIANGATGVNAPKIHKDKNGRVKLASIKTYGDCVHTLVENIDYKGPFLPGYEIVDSNDDILLNKLPDVDLHIIDHCVGNQPDGTMVQIAEWYEKALDFHRFWSVDDKQIHTEYSSLRSIVMADFDEVIKMPINEPAPGKKKSQIQEYVEYHGGPGVQHIALRTKDIVKAIQSLKSRGVKFLTIPKEYYNDLRQRLKHASIEVKEDLDIIEKLNILIDFDDKGYLLQIFTEPVEDRPTLFYEIIQRHNHEGFGAGNFKALFVSIEKAQEHRGNLTDNIPIPPVPYQSKL